MTNGLSCKTNPSAGGTGRVAIVVIGRNEGERLQRCLRSVATDAACLVYVDSNSSDGSVDAAGALSSLVVQMDAVAPFTAARARNRGWQALQTHGANEIQLIQFVDGDCEVADGWISAAINFMVAHPDVAVVCGRRRERFPERSIYNRLCDIEWNTPVGEARACGGDAMMRAAAFEQSGGFREDLIAGEEPELCVRLRALGWRIWRLDAEMTLHDAAMTRFSQWWKRSQRAGFAFAQGTHLHGAPPERHWVRESRSAWLWGAVIPLLLIAGMLVFGWLAAWLLLIYPLQVVRLFLKAGGPIAERAARAFFLVLGKFPEAFGQWRFHAQRLGGGPTRLIEYK